MDDLSFWMGVVSGGFMCTLIVLGGFNLADVKPGNAFLDECAAENNVYACEWVAQPKEPTQ